MSFIRAIILFFIYAAFVGSSSFAVHECTVQCAKSEDTHTGFSDPATAPSECTEKEVFVNPFAEHRAGSQISVCRKLSPNTKELRRYSDIHHRAMLSAGFSQGRIPGYASIDVPTYLMICALRL